MLRRIALIDSWGDPPRLRLSSAPVPSRRALSALLLAALTACSAAPPRPPTPAAGLPPVTSLHVLPDRLDAHPWLAPQAAVASAAGAGPLQILGADVASEGDRLGAFVAIPENECLLAYTRASPTIVDVDLFAYDDDGSAFATDESPDVEAAVLVCPPHPRRLYVVARVMAGAGLLAVGVQSVPRAAEAAVAKAVGTRGRPGEDSGRLDAWPGLEARIRAHRLAIGARWEDVRRVVVPLSPRAPTRISATIEANRCLDVLATPSEEVASFDLLAEDSNARILARGREQGRDRSLVLCSATTIALTLAVRPRASQGLAAITIGRSSNFAAKEISASARFVHLTQPGELEATRRALEAALAGKGYAAAKSVATGAARVGSRTSIALDLPAGCARLDVISGRPLADVAATLWDDKGAMIADTRGGAGTTIFACGKGGSARLDVEALESAGPFAVELRKDLTAPPLLVAHPVAAARLLERMGAGVDPADASSAATATLVALDPAQLKTFPITVPASSCVEVIAALDGGGTGVDLRLTAPGTDGTITRSPDVAGDRLCAGSTPIQGAYELRLGAGKADALVVTRVLGPPRDTP
jgi:hypothetical protein